MFFFRKKSRQKIEEPLVLSPQETPAPIVERPVSAPAETGASGEPVMRKRRRPVNPNKTRLMGFDTSDGRIVDLFGEDKATADTGRVQFPVAFVMVAKGPGFGEGQAIQLDFGDQAISRENHAAIVYDPKEHTFLLGHGGKSNIVRLNGKPVVSTTNLKDGDEIEIGETKLRFAALCSKKFNWEIAETEEGTDDDDVEIA